MTIASSYIFFQNPYYEEKKNPKKNTDPNIIELNVDSVHLRFRRLFSLNKNNAVKNYTVSGLFCRYAYLLAVENVTVKFDINEVGKGTYIQITVSGKTTASAIKFLESIEQKINSSDIEQKYIMIVSYDAISEYYCNKIYPKLNELERNLRKLMFNTYTLQFGEEYY